MVSRVYLDSGVILSFLKQEPERVDIVQAALLRSVDPRNGLRFFTSSMSLVEVAYIESTYAPDIDDISLIDTFWASHPIQIVEVNVLTALRGRDLLRNRAMNSNQSQPPLVRKRAADILHLATAEWLSVDEFWTYDLKDFLRYGVETLRICEPYTDQLMLPDFDVV